MVYKDRQELYEQAVSLRLNEGLGYNTIAKRLNNAVHVSTIRNWVNKFKVDSNAAYKKAVEEAKQERWPAKKDAVRKRLFEERGCICESCGLSEWLGRPITLEMHRLDPNGPYVRENIMLLCPNCHSQTDTWRKGGAYGKKKEDCQEEC